MSDKLRLYVWKNRDGGVSRWWKGKLRLTTWDNFFVFGRCGGGYSPFPPPREKLEQEVAYCAARAKERFGVDVEVVWKRPRR